MPSIQKIVIKEFKKFENLELKIENDLNILLGDNESGKSSILLALDLVLSASRSKIETLGIESLLRAQKINEFMKGSRSVADLPTLSIQLFLTYTGNPELNGKFNCDNIECDGLRLDCQVPDENTKLVEEMLKDPESPFPFEYYTTTFFTFAREPYSGYKKYVRHLVLDSSRIDSEYAMREYTKSIFSLHTSPSERNKLESDYRSSKKYFRGEKLKDLNAKIKDFMFSVRTSVKSNLESDLEILEENIPLDNRGKGRQCLVKTEFALSKVAGDKLDVLLLEEPENHLSHSSTRKLVDSLAKPDGRQIILATHSSLICSRLDLRKALLLGTQPESLAILRNLPSDTADFFIKAPDNNVLEFALSKKVILVEGNAEYILIEALYSKHSEGSSLSNDGVHVISVGGTSFKKYLDIAKLLKIKTAVIRDNDGDHQKTCIDNYEDYVMDHAKVFYDNDNTRSTFEICLYQDNEKTCNKHLSAGRKKLSVLDYMLAEKTDAAYTLLKNAKDELVAPEYIQEAISWIRR